MCPFLFCSRAAPGASTIRLRTFAFRVCAFTAAYLGGLACVPCQAKDNPAKPRPGESGSSLEQCAKVSASVRMEAYGYTHIVTLQNRCDKAVTCEVWTDVDPTPRQHLRAAPGETQEAVTRRGSPAREVNAESNCRFE